jgi:DNA-binding transcriptional ArsR family regulator
MKLEGILGSRNRVKVLRALLKRDGLCGREVGRMADLSASAANITLGELVEAGVLFRNGTPGKHQFELNRNHFLIRFVEKLYDQEALLPQRVAELVQRYLNDLPHNHEFLGLGFGDEGLVVALKPRIAPDESLLKPLQGALRSEFGEEICRTCEEVSSLAGLKHVRLGVIEKGSGRSRAFARERALSFFGLSNPKDARKFKG